MKFHIITALTLSLSLIDSAFAEVKYFAVKATDGFELQTCARYPDPVKFPGKRPALLFIQGSGAHEVCKSLDKVWGDRIVEKGVIVYGRQKRGIHVNPADGAVVKDMAIYATNTVPSLISDAAAGFEKLKLDPLVDETRIAVAGGSEGSLLSTALGSKFPEIKEVVLISSMVESFQTIFARQMYEGSQTEFVELDKDKSDALTLDELTEEYLQKNLLAPFKLIDQNRDGFVSEKEYVEEVQRIIIFSIATGNNSFFFRNDDAVSVEWIKSAFLLDPLGPQILNLSMPVTLHHGREDWHTLVYPVYDLEQEAIRDRKSGIAFQYYDGLGHALSKEIIFDILANLAGRL